MKKESESKNNMIRILSKKIEKPKKNTKWLIQIFFTTLGLSVLFALIAELMLKDASLGLALILVMLLMFGNIFFDVIGMAITVCNIKPLLELQKKQRREALIAIKLVKNADKVSSICSDVVGDICSILCGAGGVTIAIILIECFPGLNSLLISLLVNAIIASVTIAAKAIGKAYAINNPTKVVMWVAKNLSFFYKKRTKKCPKKP